MNRTRWYWGLTLVLGVFLSGVTVGITVTDFVGGRGPILMSLGGVTLALVGAFGVRGAAGDEQDGDRPADGGSEDLAFGLVLGVGVSLFSVLAGLGLTLV